MQLPHNLQKSKAGNKMTAQYNLLGQMQLSCFMLIVSVQRGGLILTLRSHEAMRFQFKWF